MTTAPLFTHCSLQFKRNTLLYSYCLCVSFSSLNVFSDHQFMVFLARLSLSGLSAPVQGRSSKVICEMIHIFLYFNQNNLTNSKYVLILLPDQNAFLPLSPYYLIISIMDNHTNDQHLYQNSLLL